MRLSEALQTYSLHDAGLYAVIFEPNFDQCKLLLELADSPGEISSSSNKLLKKTLVIRQIYQFCWLRQPPIHQGDISCLDLEILSASIETTQQKPDLETLQLYVKVLSYDPIQTDDICLLKIQAKAALWETE